MGKSSMPEGVQTVIYWALGLGILAFIALILLILFGNLSGNTGFAKGSNSVSISNESGAWINVTGYTLSGYNSSWSSIVLSQAKNGSNNTVIQAALYTVSATGVVTNTTAVAWNNAWLTYSYLHTFTTDIETNTESVITNFTQAQTNMAKQLPTVGIILGVALLLVILIGVLVFAIRKLMGAAGATGGSTGSYSHGGGFDGNGSMG